MLETEDPISVLKFVFKYINLFPSLFHELSNHLASSEKKTKQSYLKRIKKQTISSLNREASGSDAIIDQSTAASKPISVEWWAANDASNDGSISLPSLCELLCDEFDHKIRSEILFWWALSIIIHCNVEQSFTEDV